MNDKKFSEAMGEIDDKYIDEAISYGHKAKAVPNHRRLSVALVAAILALLLIGAGVAAIIYGDSIQNWFEHYWEAITGQQMSDEQAATIDHLSQEIGVSQTVGDVTITVDSATVGDDNFFLLLKVDGMNFSDEHSYNFLMGTMETSPDPLVDGAFVGWGMEYLGVDGDGSALLLLNYEYLSDNGFVQDTRPLQVWLRLVNLARDAHTDREKIIAEGEWYCSFVIDRSRPIEIISLPDTEAMATDEQQNETPVMITNIELTNTGLRFQYDYNEGTLFLSDQRVFVILKNGSIVDNDGGIGSPTEDNIDMCFSYQWFVPVNLNEVYVVQIGETQIAIPQN